MPGQVWNRTLITYNIRPIFTPRNYKNILVFHIFAKNNLMNLLKISKALADGTRYKILKTLMDKGEISCGELESHFTLSQPTISHHLKILYDCGLITAQKDGQHSLLSVNKKILQKYLQTIEGDLVR
jgi:ArsR family transcriptional regulator, arsenate/arsenite/antimonite-responsive transcriptional repressor